MKKAWSGILFILALSCALIFTASDDGKKKTAAGEVQESEERVRAEEVKNKNTELTKSESSPADASAGDPEDPAVDTSAEASSDPTVDPSADTSQEIPGDAAAEVDSEFYEKLPVPDFEELGVTRGKEEGLNYNVDAYKGKIYVSGGGLQVTVDGKEAPVILVYDEKEEKWGTLQATFLDIDLELQTVVGDGKLYFLSNSGDKLNIFAYNLETKEVKKFSSVEGGKSEIERSLVYDGGYLWMIGGSCQNSENQKWEPTTEIKRIDLSNGKVETMDMKLSCARSGALAELIDGKIIVVGGENADGEWESVTEVIDCEKETITKAASFPEKYKSKKNMTTAAVFGKNMIVAGVYSEEGIAEDTVIYDFKTEQWTTLPQRITDAELLYSEGTVSEEYFYVFGTVQDGEDGRNVFCRVKLPEGSSAEE